jgi:hypothetical protein
MAGNILGSVNFSASLDSVTGSQPLQPNGSLIVKSAPMPQVAAKPCATWVKTSDTVATITCANTFSDGNEVAIFWDGGYVVDAVVSSATSGSFVATVSNLNLPGGSTAQTVLPATNTPILISILTQATGLNILGSELDMLLIQSTQPALVELFDNSGTPVIRRTSIINSTNGMDVYPTAVGQAVPFSQTIATANFYNNSTNTAITQVVALLY